MFNLFQEIEKETAAYKRKPGFTFEFSTFDENDNPILIDIRAEVSKCRDAYGTGDSPTLYEVDILEVTLHGQPFELIGKEMNRAEGKAIEIWEGR